MEIFITEDGSHSIISPLYKVAYHSVHGAIAESQHVFIQTGLYAKAKHQKDIHILEIGFGSGLNALLTLMEAEKLNLNVFYTGLEAYPIAPESAEKLNYTAELNTPELQEVFMQMHHAESIAPTFFFPNFSFEKIKTHFEHIEFENQYDLIYFDAFAPTAQPELWTDEIMQIMFKALKPQGVLVTYCAKGEVRRTLQRAGFTTERLPGPPGKREMLRGIKNQ